MGERTTRRSLLKQAAALGAARAGKRGLWPWVPTLLLYFPLATLAAWKALIELVIAPYYWDKTSHGAD